MDAKERNSIKIMLYYYSLTAWNLYYILYELSIDIIQNKIFKEKKLKT